MLGVAACRELLPADSYFWHSGIAACLETELFSRIDRGTVPSRPSSLAPDSGWSLVGSRHPTGPPLVDRLSSFEQRRRPFDSIRENVHLDKDLLHDHDLLHDLDLFTDLDLGRDLDRPDSLCPHLLHGLLHDVYVGSLRVLKMVLQHDLGA